MNYDDKAELAWNLQDYLDRGQEPPARIEYSPMSCEGEMMSDEEIAAYISDATRTLQVLYDRGWERVQKIQAAFFADLEFLVEIGRLSQDEYNELIDLRNYRLSND
jgi:hypothetical protein